MAKSTKRPADKPARRQRTAADERHEEAYAIYRDMGPGRSLRKLVDMLKVRWPADPVPYATMQKWATRFQWGKLVAAYDLGRRQANVPGAAKSDQLPESVDDLDVLRSAASQALAMIARARAISDQVA